MGEKKIEEKYVKKMEKPKERIPEINIGEVVRSAGFGGGGRASARGYSSRRFYESQIVLGADKDYMPMAKPKKANYTSLVSLRITSRGRER